MSRHSLTRRGILAAGLACGAAGRLAFAAGEHAASDRPVAGFIDVHHHIRPPNAPPAMAALMPDWSPGAAVAGMNAAGIATGIAWPGPIKSPDPAKAAALARLWNEYGAGLGRDNPGRFGLFASLPFPHVDGCLQEIDFALDHLHADGFGIATSYDELWLGDTAFWPIYEKLDSRDAVVFVHPFDASCCGAGSLTYMRPPLDGAWIEWPMDTARTILSLMVSGTLRKFPRIRFLFCHGGGVTPLLVERIAGFKAWQHVGPTRLAEMFPDGGIAAEFSRLHFECAQACSHTNFAALQSLVPDSQILFGTDFPFFPLQYGASQFRAIGLPKAAEQQIGRANAARLLPRWS